MACSATRPACTRSDPTAMAALSIEVVALFAVALTAVSIRVFTRTVVT